MNTATIIIIITIIVVVCWIQSAHYEGLWLV